ncbi:MAG: hypothetical protein ACWGQW_01825 [bacterium]
MNKQQVMIDDVPCWYQSLGPIKHSVIERYPMERTCPVCGEEIDTLEGRVLIINNYVMFPNVSCHLDCFPMDKAEETIRQIKEHYEKSKAALEQALDEGKAWFSHIEI